MHISPAILLIVAVFTTQILVLSVIVPRWFQRAYSDIRKRFPPEAYPRLYPFSVEREIRLNLWVSRVHKTVILGAVGIVIGALIEHVDPVQLGRLMCGYALVQVLPVMMRASWQRRLARAYRDMPAPAVRTAELTPLRLTQFVPPSLILLGLVGTTAGTVTASLLYTSQPPPLSLRAALLAGICALVLLRMLYVLLRPLVLPRPDPYMADGDVFRARRLRLRSLFVAGAVIGTSYTLMEMQLLGAVSIDAVYLCVAASLVGQVFYLHIMYKVLHSLAERDISVYRTNLT